MTTKLTGIISQRRQSSYEATRTKEQGRAGANGAEKSRRNAIETKMEEETAEHRGERKGGGGIYHCGYHSEKSFGAASYFIVHPERNILVDNPKYIDKLARRFEMMGGARYIFLTHRDDIADHMKWSKRLGCDRIIHSEEVDASTAEVECKLEGNGPWKLADDLEFIHTLGHIKGSVCLLHKSLKVLFVGDHITMDESRLCISEIYNWFSILAQIQSVKKLTQFDFEWILPGHRRRAKFRDIEDKNSALESFVAASGRSSGFGISGLTASGRAGKGTFKAPMIALKKRNSAFEDVCGSLPGS
ncbi:uncharacterized protein LOC141700134 [Apium graveolens]|uniref:uncharacterized protein LOC141700134 n=1 Tax=Apium graveolens TaxID=4045 RepID=UPI003D7BA536